MNGIETQHENAINIIRLNLLSPVGRKAADKFNVRIVPTTLLFDGSGVAVSHQVGMPDTDRLAEHLRNLI